MRPLPRQTWGLLLRASLLRRDGQGPVPQTEGRWQCPPLQSAALARFRQQLGHPQALPLSFLYPLAQRAQLDWMLQPAFPHRLLGMVHMAQSLQREAGWADWQTQRPFTLQLRAQAEGKRNLRLLALAEQDGAPLWRAESLYRPPRGEGSRPLKARGAEPLPESAPLAHWALPADAGRRYGWLSGDLNPIHLWPWTARVFGLQAPIIHGAHTLARCEAELTRALDAPLQAVHLAFLRPLALPGQATLYREGAQAFAVYGATGRCAQGTFS